MWDREELRPPATMDDAHREWHRNTGTPMGTPGCPQDACHGDDGDDEYPEDFRPFPAAVAPPAARITCGNCGATHHAVAEVRDCYTTYRHTVRGRGIR
jgi:hypothetical protein